MKKVLLFFFILFSFKLSAATITAAASGGNWGSTSTWVGGVLPATTDAVTINAGTTVTLDNSYTCNNLVLNGTLNDNGYTLTLGRSNNAGAIITGSGTHNSTGSGKIQVTGLGLLKITGSSVLTLGNLTINQGTSDGTNTNMADVGGGTVAIAGVLTLNSTGVFVLQTKTLSLNNSVVNPQYFSGTAVNTLISGSGTSISAAGTLLFKSSTVTFPSNLIGASSPLTGLTIDVGSGNTYTLPSNLTMTGKLTLTSGTFSTGTNTLSVGLTGSTIAPNATLLVPTGGTANFNSFSLTIQSDATGSGSIAAVAGTLSGVSNVTVQRYVGNTTPQQQWRMIGFPLLSSTSISASTLATLFGIGSVYNAYIYNEVNDDGANYNGANSGAVNGGWAAFTGSATTTADKGILMSGGTPTTILSATGTLNTGGQSIALTKSKNGWNLIANPYASNINWTTIAANNASLVNNAIYRYDPNSTAYASYIPGNSPASTGNQSNVIENGAGFFVQAKVAGNLSIAESDKTTGAISASLMGLQPITSQNKSIIKLSLQKQGDQYADEVVLRWGGGVAATDNFDGDFDAYDLGRSIGPNLSVIGNDKTVYSIFHGSELKINSDENRTVQLGIKNMEEGTYQIGIQLQSPMVNGNKAYLYDSYTNTYTLLDDNTGTYTFVTSGDAKSQSSNRFSIVMNVKETNTVNDNSNLPVILLNNPSTNNLFTLYSKNNYTKLQWQIVDNSGRLLQSGLLGNVIKGSTYQINGGNTSQGNYYIKLNGDSNNLPVLKAIKN